MKIKLGLVSILLISSLILISIGCTKKAASSQEAIKNAETLNNVQEKINYLIKQAEAFYNSKEFQQAIQIAQYILNNLDKDSQSAKDLMEKAKVQLQATA
ncbi:MAG: hypothetical protein NC817_00740 [Candidatus Omnitrophica bacterium]|nr:hypothetical protein [Candidatus Omnitrophota bacterium]MCM8823200.1 hypothetical protein [Candidatus Omnitrophota bacterium]MCM8826524.1 hypothetical protein [Candidatus Omnitrophota bacterium]